MELQLEQEVNKLIKHNTYIARKHIVQCLRVT
jgi:hypothetical protein